MYPIVYLWTFMNDDYYSLSQNATIAYTNGKRVMVDIM